MPGPIRNTGSHGSHRSSEPSGTHSAAPARASAATEATSSSSMSAVASDGFEVHESSPPATAARPAVPAENFMKPLSRSFALDPKSPRGHKRLLGTIDFSVRNFEFHKKMAVQVEVTRENGAVETMMYRPRYKGNLPDGSERWGIDGVALFPDSSPHGKIKHVDINYLVQADTDGDWRRETTHSKQSYRVASYADLTAPPGASLGSMKAAGPNPDFGTHPLDTSGASGASVAFKDTIPPVEVYFAPYDNPERAIIGEINTVTKAKQANPQGHHYIHASVFNINDDRIVDALLKAHEAGVEVKLLTAAHQMTPEKTWQTQYARLQRAGIDVIGISREGMFASNHTKFANFDGKVVSTGSHNWSRGSAEHNSENVMLLRSPEIAAVYEQMFEAIAGGVIQDRPIDPASKLNVYYSQQHDVARVIHDEIDKATQSIDISMFTLRSLKSGSQDVLDALVKAHRRGVKVNVLLEKNIADAGEYYGRTTPNDMTDEWLSAQGIQVTKIRTNTNNHKYAAMHHKFAVIDGNTTLTGASNWYSGTQSSDDDLVVVRDATIAKRYKGEITNLRRHYDPGFDPASVPATSVSFNIHHPYTSPGDTVYLIGDIPELGGWDPTKAIPLNADNWPAWQADVDIPAGTHFNYKLLVKNHWGRFWEPGPNREHTADTENAGEMIAAEYR